MRIDSEDVRHHYASLADEELAALNPDDLTEAARAVYEAELARRGLTIRLDGDGASESADAGASAGRQGEVEEPASDIDEAGTPGVFDIDVAPPPEWLEDAASVCSLSLRSVTAGRSSDLTLALKARAVLRQSGIPCHLTFNQEQDEDDPPRADSTAEAVVSVMVPGALALHATSVLDREIFNDEKESEWRNHLEGLSDEELRALDPDVFCAGYWIWWRASEEPTKTRSHGGNCDLAIQAAAGQWRATKHFRVQQI